MLTAEERKALIFAEARKLGASQEGRTLTLPKTPSRREERLCQICAKGRAVPFSHFAVPLLSPSCPSLSQPLASLARNGPVVSASRQFVPPVARSSSLSPSNGRRKVVSAMSVWFPSGYYHPSLPFGCVPPSLSSVRQGSSRGHAGQSL